MTTATGIQWRTMVFTATALVAFAANSLLCRIALGGAAIDAASFSMIRLLSGALALSVILGYRDRGLPRIEGSWSSAGLLFLYAVPFSFAYMKLTAGSGALILFGAVQSTMILWALNSGERPRLGQWTGLIVALAGLVYLVFPGLQAPSPLGSGLMAVAGIAWGIYSIRGRAVTDSVSETAGNFCRSVPMALAVSIVALDALKITPYGAVLAIASGALASGLGYAIWYTALASLTSTHAATVQLIVPILASVGGLVFLGEPISLRLVFSTVMILGGVGLTLLPRD